MIWYVGGGSLAYGLIGIDWNEHTGDVRWLILDPHYTGAEHIPSIINKRWCAWHTSSLFHTAHFYNFCLLQRPRVL
jgi:hypothetical protein